jgi:hypothetical protein
MVSNSLDTSGPAAEPARELDREPRWPAFIAIVAVGGLYTALPEALTIRPHWLFPALVLALSIPGLVFHHTGRHRLNMVFGFAVDALLTVGLIVSVVLLIDSLPSRKGTHPSSSCSRQHRFGSQIS